jgi:hypothetical protein
MGPAVETARCGGELNVMWVQRGAEPNFLGHATQQILSRHKSNCIDLYHPFRVH